MEISIKGFIYHKDAETFVDCFDRYAFDLTTNKFAVSDGVSKSFFPGLWAELLVDAFTRAEGRINLDNLETYKNVQLEWFNRVRTIVHQPNQKYYVRNFFAQGRAAAATFVGLHFYRENNEFNWEALALGDSFLFFIPENISSIEATTFDRVTYLSSKTDFEFDNFPDFFDSKGDRYKGKIKQIRRRLINGTFYLMTDALSEWFISEKQIAIEEIERWNSQDDFERSIIRLRKQSLYNDDSAILILKVKDDFTNELKYRNILVSSLSSLATLKKEDSASPDQLYLNKNIGQELNSVASNITEEEPHPDLIKNQPKQEEEINRSYRPQPVKEIKRKKGLWERFFDYWGWSDDDLLEKYYSANSDYSKRISNPDKSEAKDKKGDDPQDISSITDKF